MKTNSIALVVAASSFAVLFTSCKSKEEQVREGNLEQKADSMENTADAVRKNADAKADAKENNADATRNMGEKKADAIENEADKVRDLK